MAWFYEMLQVPGCDATWIEAFLLAAHTAGHLVVGHDQYVRQCFQSINGADVLVDKDGRFFVGSKEVCPPSLVEEDGRFFDTRFLDVDMSTVQHSFLENQLGKFLQEQINTMRRKELGVHRLRVLQLFAPWLYDVLELPRAFQELRTRRLLMTPP